MLLVCLSGMCYSGILAHTSAPSVITDENSQGKGKHNLCLLFMVSVSLKRVSTGICFFPTYLLNCDYAVHSQKALCFCEKVHIIQSALWLGKSQRKTRKMEHYLALLEDWSSKLEFFVSNFKIVLLGKMNPLIEYNIRGTVVHWQEI